MTLCVAWVARLRRPLATVRRPSGPLVSAVGRSPGDPVLGEPLSERAVLDARESEP